MKKSIQIILASLVLLVSLSGYASNHPASFTYEAKTGDIGALIVTAKDKKTAFVAAGNECFDRRVALYESQRGAIDEDRMLDIIDSCANLSW